MAAEVDVLMISGSMGSGKTTVLAEASDLLTLANIIHGAIDLDHLAFGHLPPAASGDFVCQNLAALWSNYAAAGVRRLLLSEALDSREKRDRIQEAIPGSHVVVCRLQVTLETMRQRVRARETGILREQFVNRVGELEALLNAAALEDFSIENENRPVTVVARELLIRAGWL